MSLPQFGKSASFVSDSRGAPQVPENYLTPDISQVYPQGAYNKRPMTTVTFPGSFRYTVSPHRWTYPKALGTILAWPDLKAVAQFAQERRSFGNTDFGVGLNYPDRPERAGQVQIWRWDWNRPRTKTRSFHIPEADYLATLAGLLRLRGLVEQAESVEALQALPTITVMGVPDPFYIGNYTLEPFTYDAYHALRLILEHRDFEKAARKADITFADGSGISFRGDGTALLTLVRGHTAQVSVALYDEILTQARKRAPR
jgi:hypothetical protein